MQLMSAPTKEQPAASDARAELPLPANGIKRWKEFQVFKHC